MLNFFYDVSPQWSSAVPMVAGSADQARQMKRGQPLMHDQPKSMK